MTTWKIVIALLLAWLGFGAVEYHDRIKPLNDHPKIVKPFFAP